VPAIPRAVIRFARSGVPMSLKVMCAGCSKDEREQAESDVRKAIGARADGSDTWIVSVVKVQGRWSVTLDGPAIRALTCTAPPGHLGQAIREALDAKTGAAAPPAAAPAATSRPAAPPAAAAPPAPRPSAPAPSRAAAPPAAAPSPPAVPRTSAPVTPAAFSAPAPRPAASGDGAYACEKCGLRFRVVYDAVPGEERTPAPVACPHCWHVNRVPVGENASADGDYRAEKA